MGNKLVKGCGGSSLDSTTSALSVSSVLLTKQNPSRDKLNPPLSGGTLTLSQFEVIKSVGRGSFGRVCLVRRKSNGKVYALKYINKEQCVRQNSVRNIINERRLLERINYCLICNLQAAFQDAENMYILIDPMTGGDLAYHLERVGFFPEEVVRFFVAEISLSLEYLHKRRIVHRDIKPANILLDEHGHCHLTDFNVAGRTHSDRPMRTTAGTYNYIAPEVFLKNGYDEKVDWWSLGVLMFECLYGKTPFRGKTRPEIRDAVLKHEITYPKKRMSFQITPECQSALHGFLHPDPSLRLGAPNPLPFRAHSWLAMMDFDALEKKTSIAPFQPDLDAIKNDTTFVLEEALMNETPLQPQKAIKKPHKEEMIPGTPWYIMREEFTEYDRYSLSRTRSARGSIASANSSNSNAENAEDETKSEQAVEESVLPAVLDKQDEDESEKVVISLPPEESEYPEAASDASSIGEQVEKGDRFKIVLSDNEGNMKTVANISSVLGANKVLSSSTPPPPPPVPISTEGLINEDLETANDSLKENPKKKKDDLVAATSASGGGNNLAAIVESIKEEKRRKNMLKASSSQQGSGYKSDEIASGAVLNEASEIKPDSTLPLPVEPAPPAESAVEPAIEPVVEPAIEPAVEPAIEPVVEPAIEPAVEPAIEPAGNETSTIESTPAESPPTNEASTIEPAPAPAEPEANETSKNEPTQTESAINGSTPKESTSTEPTGNESLSKESPSAESAINGSTPKESTSAEPAGNESPSKESPSAESAINGSTPKEPASTEPAGNESLSKESPSEVSAAIEPTQPTPIEESKPEESINTDKKEELKINGIEGKDK